MGRPGDLSLLGHFQIEPSSFRLLHGVRQLGSQDPVPEDEEGLRKVEIAAVGLVVELVVGGVVAEEKVQRVPGDPHPAVDVHRPNGDEGEEDHGGAGGHPRDGHGDEAAAGVEEEPFWCVVVKRPKGVRRHQAVVFGMRVAVDQAVGVHQSVQEVLPCVHNQQPRHQSPGDLEARLVRGGGATGVYHLWRRRRGQSGSTLGGGRGGRSKKLLWVVGLP